MAIPVTCPHCQARYNAPIAYAGKSVLCPRCKQKLTVPSIAAPASPAEPVGDTGRASSPQPPRPRQDESRSEKGLPEPLPPRLPLKPKSSPQRDLSDPLSFQPSPGRANPKVKKQRAVPVWLLVTGGVGGVAILLGVIALVVMLSRPAAPPATSQPSGAVAANVAPPTNPAVPIPIEEKKIAPLPVAQAPAEKNRRRRRPPRGPRWIGISIPRNGRPSESTTRRVSRRA